jgi:hypothetical protein
MTGPDGALERSLRDGPSDEAGYRPQPLGSRATNPSGDGAGTVQRARAASVRTVRRPGGASAWQSIAAVLAVAVGLAIVGLIVRDRGNVGEPSPVVHAGLLPPLSETFVSTRNGFSIQYPAGWHVVPATTSWREGAFVTIASPAYDNLSREGVARILIASQRLAADLTEEERLVAPRVVRCDGDPSTWPRLAIDGESGYLSGAGCTTPADNGRFAERDVSFHALVFSGGRFYMISLNGDVELADFKALLATIRLDPSSAIDPP